MTVNSGGVVFYALFKTSSGDESSAKEAAAVIKIASSRMATQSERLGYEFAKLLGVKTPQVPFLLLIEFLSFLLFIFLYIFSCKIHFHLTGKSDPQLKHRMATDQGCSTKGTRYFSCQWR